MVSQYIGSNSQQVWHHNSPHYSPLSVPKQGHSRSWSFSNTLLGSSHLKVSQSSTTTSRILSTSNWAHASPSFTLSSQNTVELHLEILLDLPKCCNKSVVSSKKLGTLLNLTILKDPQLSTYKEWSVSLVTPLHCYTKFCCAALVSGTKKPQCSTSWILQNSGESCRCSWYQNHRNQHITHIRPCHCKEVIQDNECAPGKALMWYEVKFSIYHLLFHYLHLVRSIHCNKRKKTQYVLQS